ncbi:MAG: glycosyl hydrolase family 2 [Bacteroidaceae bacterium]|nr:glycosyl hydrolase family 2 [Bacteroidaceae bacterium]
MKRLLTLCIPTFLLLLTFNLPVSAQTWPTPRREARPYTRWWWMGSAVDSVGLRWNMEQMAAAGLGGVEITPIYGVQGNERNDIPFLSSRWMKMLGYAETLAERLDMDVDMATGTGWPWGGPDVTEEQAACKMVVKDETISPGRTRQKVKRAAPGGEGWVIDHFDRDAVRSYLAAFETAFTTYRIRRPHTFFNDSYEVYGADWTPRFYEEFERRRGYRLQDHLDPMLHPGSHGLVGGYSVNDKKYLLSDYRETLGELLLDHCTRQWTDWAHRAGSTTRNQAHGSPANLIDVYAAVDIPECEGFGLTDFGIKGLRTDSGFTKRNDSDLSMLKYASSAAHITGKPLTSSETFTWLTEHFRTSLSQCKPDLDLMFVAGVNHVFFHGTCYSPKDEPWPAWQFYASVDMSPQNPQWNAMPAFSAYITRCQSFLQWGEPDNDLLVYLPYYDMIHDAEGTVTLFDIHSMQRRAPRFIKAVQTLIDGGLDVDYVSDEILCKSDVYKKYSAIIIPMVRYMPLETLQRLDEIAQAGARVIFVGRPPEAVPGFGRRMQGQQEEFERVMNDAVKKHCQYAASYEEALLISGGHAEPMRTEQGLSCIRRTNPDGHHYFISNLTPNDVDAFVTLGVEWQDALFFNPMNGQVTRPEQRDGKLRIQLASGESIIVRTRTRPLPIPPQREGVDTNVPLHHYTPLPWEGPGGGSEMTLTAWTLTFPQAAPVPIKKTYTLSTPKSWTELGDDVLKTTMATGLYKTTFATPTSFGKDSEVLLDLGDVRESARVVINGKEAGTLFAVPYRLDITPYIKKGTNTLEVYVTNLPANRIAQMDRDGIKWRRFKDANVVDINYQRTTYDAWTPMPSGLCSDVKILYY